MQALTAEAKIFRCGGAMSVVFFQSRDNRAALDSLDGGSDARLERHWLRRPARKAGAGNGVAAVAHADVGWTKVALVLPVAAAVSLGRHFGGSVRAGIVLHVLNNSAGIALAGLIANAAQ